MILYHGTRAPEAVLRGGFQLAHGTRKKDPGDFGLGIYFTQRLARARCYGTVLRCEVDTSRFASVPNPYFLEGLQEVPPVTPAERLFHAIAFDGTDMRTVRDPEAAGAVRAAFLAAGYTGIASAHYGGEWCAYDLTTIIALDRYGILP